VKFHRHDCEREHELRYQLQRRFWLDYVTFAKSSLTRMNFTTMTSMSEKSVRQMARMRPP
jgi:hypothetical protein